MAENTDPAGGEADSGAAQRYKSERDEARQQAAEATRVLGQYQKRDAARGALKGKVEDPDSVADLIAPHLADVELKDVATHIASEDFAPRLAAFKAAAEVPGGEPGEGEEPAPATETPGFGGGPSLGGGANGGGSNNLPQESKIIVGSKEWDELISGGDRDAIDAAYKAGRIIEPVKGY